MGNAFLYGNGSGVDLQFNVVWGDQPVGPTENMIWVSTTTAVTDYVFSATSPESPDQGSLWIKMDSSYLNTKLEILEEDKITISLYPSIVSQYIDGMWVKKTAKLYKSGEWVDLTYKHILVPNTSVPWIVSEGVSGMNFSINSDGTLTFSKSSSANVDTTYIYTYVDVTNYNSIIFSGTFQTEGSSLASSSYLYIGIYSDTIGNWKTRTSTTNTGDKISKVKSSLNTKSLTGIVQLRVAIGGGHTGVVNTATFNSIYLSE